MKIGGFQKFSLIDYPGKICAIIFTQGCNFRCPYCHNPELVKPDMFQEPIPEKYIFDFLKKRIGKLDAVSITGGEPTIHEDLPEFIRNIKQLGFLVKLDTNGTNPGLLWKLIEEKLVDYLAMDIKAPLRKYDMVTRVYVNKDVISQSIELIKKSNVEYEFRSTLVANLLSQSEVLDIGNLLGKVKRFFLQKFVSSKTLDGTFFNEVSFSNDKLLVLQNKFKNFVSEFAIR